MATSPLYYNFLNALNPNSQPNSPFRRLTFNQPVVTPPTPPVTRLGRITPGTDKLRELLASAPTKEKYHASKLGTAGALLTGAAATLQGDPLAGYQAYSNIMDRPYREARQEYGDQINQYSALSQLERQDYEDDLAEEQAKQAQSNWERQFGFQGSQFDWQRSQDQIRNEQTNRQIGIAARERYTDPVTGIVYFVDEQGNKHPVGQGQLTFEEKLQQAKQERSALGEIDFGLNKRMADLNFKNQSQLQQQGGDIARQNSLFSAAFQNYRDQQRIDAQTTAAQARIDAKMGTSKERFGQLFNDLTVLESQNEGISNYFTFDETAVPPIKLTYPDATDEKGIRYNAILRAAIAKLSSPKGPAPSGNLPPGWIKR